MTKQLSVALNHDSLNYFLSEKGSTIARCACAGNICASLGFLVAKYAFAVNVILIEGTECLKGTLNWRAILLPVRPNEQGRELDVYALRPKQNESNPFSLQPPSSLEPAEAAPAPQECNWSQWKKWNCCWSRTETVGWLRPIECASDKVELFNIEKVNFVWKKIMWSGRS